MPRRASILAAGCLTLALLACGGTMSISQPDPEVAYRFPFNKGGQVIDPSFSAVEADQFRIKGDLPVLITALAVEHAADDQADREVGLFDGGGNLLAKTTISVSDTLKDGYHYKDIFPPIQLTAGNTYIVGALHVEGTKDNYIWNTNAANTPQYIEDLGTCYAGTATMDSHLSFTPPGTPRHYSANMMTQLVVPQ